MLIAPTEKWIFGQVVVPNYGPVLHPKARRVLTLPDAPANWLVHEGYGTEVIESDLDEDIQFYPGRPNCDPAGGIAIAKPDSSSWFVEPELIPIVGFSDGEEINPMVTGKEDEVEPTGGNPGIVEEPSVETSEGSEENSWHAIVIKLLSDPETAKLPSDHPSIKGIGPKLFTKLLALKNPEEPLTGEFVTQNLTDNQVLTVKNWAKTFSTENPSDPLGEGS